MEEIWKEIPGFPGYEVSNQGQVHSYFCRVGGMGRWEIAENPQRTLCPSRHPGGYRGVGLRRNGKTHRRHIGRLVLLAFVGPPPDGMEMCHNDGNSANDCLANLRWDTRSANAQDMIVHGRGIKPRLNQTKVYVIRTKFASGRHSRQELAEEYGISHHLIWYVLTGRGAYKGGPGPIQKRTWLTDQQAEAIRRERVSGKSLANLAEKYGMSESAISLIASGKRHSNAGGPRVQPWEISIRT